MKKFLSFALSIAIAGSATLGSAYNVKAATTSSNAEYYIKQAEYWAGALKWQISVEYKKDVMYPDMKIFNNTKDNILKAKKELNRLSGAQKANLEKRLADNAELQYTRAIGYIDAITSGKMLVKQANEFTDLYNADPLSNETEQAYHDLSYRIKHTAKSLYKVYGKTTREAILKEYKLPSESAKNDAANTITAKIALDTLDKQIADQASQDVIDEQVIKILSLIDVIEEDVSYDLWDRYLEAIHKDPHFIAELDKISEFFVKHNELTNAKDVDGIIGLYHEESDMTDGLRELLEPYFAEMNVTYEPVDLQVYSIVKDEATVIYIENEISNDGAIEDEQFVYLFILKKDANGEWKIFDGQTLVDGESLE